MIRMLIAFALFSCLTACSPALQESIPEGYSVLASAQGDLDGDNRPETVRLIGRPFQPDSPYQEELSLLVGATLWPLPTSASSGYEPSLRVLDLTGDGRDNVMLVASTGGSGGLVAGVVVTASPADGQWRFSTIFDAESGRVPRLSGTFVDGFLAHLLVESTGGHHESATLDLSSHRDQYIEAEVYHADGVLSKSVDIWGEGLMGLEPVTIEGGGPGLRLIQQARGVSNADRLAVITTVIVWRGDTWSTTSVEITPIP